MKIIILICASLTLLVGCATPTVIETRRAEDSTLNCMQLKAGYDEAIGYEKKARDERGVTGKNTAAVLFFPLALVGTYMNSGDAINAARERQSHIAMLMDGKKCNFDGTAKQ
jgi:hypothetical protein